MRKIILTVLIVTLCGTAAAKWVQFESSDEDRYYADPDTIRKSGNILRMWILRDFKSAQPSNGFGKEPYLSTKVQREYDCKEGYSRMLYFSSYSMNMGEGEVIFINNTPGSAWSPIVPGSIGETQWKLACGKQ